MLTTVVLPSPLEAVRFWMDFGLTCQRQITEKDLCSDHWYRLVCAAKLRIQNLYFSPFEITTPPLRHDPRACPNKLRIYSKQSNWHTQIFFNSAYFLCCSDIQWRVGLDRLWIPFSKKSSPWKRNKQQRSTEKFKEHLQNIRCISSTQKCKKSATASAGSIGFIEYCTFYPERTSDSESSRALWVDQPWSEPEQRLGK